MQPLYSVDHESRHSTYQTEEDSASPEEETPLLRFPESVNSDRSMFMTVTVSLLLLVLITGVIIGIYLLVLQNNSENVLPPVETPLQLVSRKQWDPAGGLPDLLMSRIKAKQVIIVQTDTEPCQNTYTCAALLQSIQGNKSSTENKLPYNFLVSSNGQTYEALGWYRPSALSAQYPDSLVLGFIGNFTDTSPTRKQIEEAKNFFAESVSQQHLDPTYVIFGKNTTYSPKLLFSALMSLPQWDSELSDV